MNFFAWIREGVRQAVLLGVSDAVSNIGTPPEGDDIAPRLLEALRDGNQVALAPSTNKRNGGGKRKKLGRSLSEAQAATADS